MSVEKVGELTRVPGLPLTCFTEMLSSSRYSPSVAAPPKENVKVGLLLVAVTIIVCEPVDVRPVLAKPVETSTKGVPVDCVSAITSKDRMNVVPAKTEITWFALPAPPLVVTLKTPLCQLRVPFEPAVQLVVSLSKPPLRTKSSCFTETLSTDPVLFELV